MGIRSHLAAAALVAAVALPSAAAAQSFAVAAAGTTNVRSGPGTQYTVVGKVRGGTRLTVGNCASGWCGVAAPGVSGYMARSRLQLGYANAPVVQPQPYPVYPQPYPYSSYPGGYYGYGGPSISFSFGNYDRRDRRHRRGNDWSDNDRHDRGDRNGDCKWRNGRLDC